MKAFLWIVFAYVFPILIGYIYDYISCPKGTTLGDFLAGRWYMPDVDRDEWEDPYDSLASKPNLLYFPVFNWLIVICIVLVALHECLNSAMKKMFGGISIKDLKNIKIK